jgi:hypothetical protein
VETENSPVGSCGNCGAALSGPFCSQCGEKRFSRRDYSIAHFVEEAIGAFTHLDSKLLRTLKVLLTKPGQLSSAYFHGGRSRYTKPVTLFIIINIVFFFAQPYTGLFGYQFAQYVKDPVHATLVRDHLQTTGESQQTYVARFNTNLHNQKKSLLIVAVPLLALFMGLVFAGTGRTFAEHFVLSVEVYAFLLIFVTVVGVVVLFPLIDLMHAAGPTARQIALVLDSEYTFDAIILGGISVYMYLGFRRAYRIPRVRGGLSAIILSLTVGALIAFYHNALFYITFWTT